MTKGAYVGVGDSAKDDAVCGNAAEAVAALMGMDY
jgi:hypothetical protein